MYNNSIFTGIDSTVCYLDKQVAFMATTDRVCVWSHWNCHVTPFVTVYSLAVTAN